MSIPIKSFQPPSVKNITVHWTPFFRRFTSSKKVIDFFQKRLPFKLCKKFLKFALQNLLIVRFSNIRKPYLPLVYDRFPITRSSKRGDTAVVKYSAIGKR